MIILPFFSEEPAKEATLTPLPGSKEEASPPKQAVQSIDYHANVVACDVTVGFPSVTFINQVVYVIRSTKETFDELRGRRKISDSEPTTNRQNTEEDVKRRSSSYATVARLSTSSDTTEPPTSTVQTPQNVEESGGAKTKVQIDSDDGKAPVITIEVPEISPSTGQKRNSRNRVGSPVKRQRSGETEKNRQNSTPTQSQPHWTKRMLTMLRDFQRAKRSSVRRQSPITPSPNSDAILVTTVLGAIDCSKVEINAIFTELFAYATFKSVQLGHKSTESWTAVGPSQLRSSDKSVRGALKQINLMLSEAQSMHSIPVNVLTFSVSESHVIFRRFLLHLLSPLRDDPWRNSLGVEIGPIHVDIPLHPGSLHGLVVRGTRNISDRLPFLMTPSVVEEVVHIKKESSVGHYSRKFDKFEKVAVIHFKVGVKEFQVDAALLPSLKASYKMMELGAFGETGSEAKFQVKVPHHEVAFDVKGILAESPSLVVAPKILVAFPTIDAKGAYVHHSQRQEGSERVLNSDILFKEGGYLQIDVEVGGVQHTLTTDLLNQLLFIQEAFTREIGDIIQKIKSEKKPATFWSSQASAVAKKQQLLYSIEVTVNAIQIMATTPTASAIRLGKIFLFFYMTSHEFFFFRYRKRAFSYFQSAPEENKRRRIGTRFRRNRIEYFASAGSIGSGGQSSRSGTGIPTSRIFQNGRQYAKRGVVGGWIRRPGSDGICGECSRRCSFNGRGRQYVFIDSIFADHFRPTDGRGQSAIIVAELQECVRILERAKVANSTESVESTFRRETR